MARVPFTWRRTIRTLFVLLALACTALVNASESVSYIHTDAGGSPIAATDANGNVVWRESCRPYGERTQNQPAPASNWQFFHGKAFDSDTGLSYFGARYDDPAIGRFMGIDPAGFDENNLHSSNRYASGLHSA
jgi:RHS repeat-associated protein